MIPDLRIKRWLHHFNTHRLADLARAIRRRHYVEDARQEWELADTEPGVRR